ncbi:Neuralized [Ancylostoma caninum]|uniref:Neuralized n=1 Tax=Ancylostoma caninum TaxID=29170 RepID=A0A368HAL8_ANCCA|nr:Neuralized [Ancylostoma caninum]
MVDSFSDLDGITVNQGTVDTRLPQLGFHSVHGQNVILQKGGRVARRKESFCKGLAFSNRPVSVNENVCIRLTEVSTSWSGVLRFGVTNVDPETYRNIQVPKFACPDLTSKEGFWAKALPERYSVEGNILHFSITHTGDLYYGVNGVHKGVFLVGINVSLPIWIIVDIYGNSVAVEFVGELLSRGSSLWCTLSAFKMLYEST